MEKCVENPTEQGATIVGAELNGDERASWLGASGHATSDGEGAAIRSAAAITRSGESAA